ncbi:hypothetical protein AVBRAN12640_07470 [Campylobacter sp. RM12640]|uniref:hypothetical protein n=1 Tax=unclassified Campylobacter TaxID=2593542 RepID=UPI001BDA2E01|nr:hypothetical protein [Campylobacter sp. 2018MI01]MBT0879455.1 hypothetical protein [Campylobacter sp. 2018MI01]MBZ7982372.1 hypothetical protein [Campylobacter sp. RM12640]MBZ7989555.1 hypothetical protein [Campylobacter sp. RM12635]
MKKSKYILEVLVVVAMSVGFVFKTYLDGFDSNSFLSITTIILLGTTFYESYKKDKLIAKLQVKNLK